MDSCQLIRKETKMDVIHLNQKQLAARWCISEATLERWRSEGNRLPAWMAMAIQKGAPETDAGCV
jgi:DNA-binding transcriptional regulator YiaG